MQNIMIYLGIIAVMFMTGCGTVYEGKQSSAPFGSSVRMAIASQTANPEAGSDAPVVGIDGKYAAAAAAKYQAGPIERKDRESVSTFGVVDNK